MQELKLLFVYVFTASFLNISMGFMNSDIEYDGQMSVALQHSFDNTPNPVYIDRGVINVQSLRSGTVKLNQGPLSDEHKFRLNELAKHGGNYRLKALVTTSAGTKYSFLSFCRANDLLESQLADIITISLDFSGEPIAVSMATASNPCDDSCKISKFNTTVFVKHTEAAPVPDTTAYVRKLEKEKEARERGETKDNRSFFAKYWMYIVPVVIFVLVSSAANPEAGGAR